MLGLGSIRVRRRERRGRDPQDLMISDRLTVCVFSSVCCTLRFKFKLCMVSFEVGLIPVIERCRMCRNENLVPYNSNGSFPPRDTPTRTIRCADYETCK